MKSAYVVLGIPGNSSSEDIEAAFTKAQTYYTPARLAADPVAVDKFLDVKNAYKVLRDTESRAAHDRKLNVQTSMGVASSSRRSAPRVAMEPQIPWYTRPLPILSLAVILVFSAGLYINQKHVAAAKALAERELQEKKVAEAALKLEAQRMAEEAAEKTQLARRAEQQDRQFRQESDRAISGVRSAESQRNYLEAQQARNEQNEERQREYEARSREQAASRLAQQRLAADKARIRELCYINYRRPDC